MTTLFRSISATSTLRQPTSFSKNSHRRARAPQSLDSRFPSSNSGSSFTALRGPRSALRWTGRSPANTHTAAQAQAGGGDRTRTDDTLVANQVLYQLSYAPVGIQPARSSCASRQRTRAAEVVGLSGLEPPTSRLSGERSNQLSYRPGGIAPPPVQPPAVAGAPNTETRWKERVALV